jgi:Uncharacterized alpha/beta hydrolase domain (DUF2235)
MYRVSRDHADTAIEPSQQVVFYDAGLGTDIGSTALTAPVRFVQKLLGSVTGAGIKRNIADCYEFIVNHYQPGDRIFLLGFSRGAYTVRSLANLLMLCGIPTKTPDGPVMRFRKAVRDIAWEAVNTVLEHGAGHPRKEFEAERLELARRFQLKYGSGDGSDSNAAPYFVGVFDTVAALGASGMRYLLIQAGLAAGVSLAAFIGGFVPAVVIAALYAWTFGNGFMVVGFALQVLIVALADGMFWYWQNKATIKTITDYPAPGQSRSHKAEWKGENFDRLLSRHVAFARAANAIDETRKDFDRSAGAAAKKARRTSPAMIGLFNVGLPATIPMSEGLIPSRNHACPISRCGGCANRRPQSPTAFTQLTGSITEADIGAAARDR